jgi:hypothetical protein
MGRIFVDVNGDPLFCPAWQIGTLTAHTQAQLQGRGKMKAFVLIHESRMPV